MFVLIRVTRYGQPAILINLLNCVLAMMASQYYRLSFCFWRGENPNIQTYSLVPRLSHFCIIIIHTCSLLVHDALHRSNTSSAGTKL